MAVALTIGPDDNAKHIKADDAESINVTNSRPQPDVRVEPIPKEGFPHHQYPRWIGHKFEPNGRLLPFPGNTVICHVPQGSLLKDALEGLHDALTMQKFSSWFVMLPPSSWHMTVYEGISDQIRRVVSWPEDLSMDAPLDDCTALFKKKLEAFNLVSNPPFRMSVEGFEPLDDGIALKVVPATPEEEKRLRGLRDRLATLFRARHPGHETYSFHISLSYMLRHLNQRQHDELWGFLQSYRSQLPISFELGAPEFCTFDDMFAFHTQFYLETKA